MFGQEMIVPEDDDVTGGQIMIVPEDKDFDDIDAIPDVDGMGFLNRRWLKGRRRHPKFNLRRFKALRAKKRKQRSLLAAAQQKYAMMKAARGGYGGAFIGRPGGIDISASPTGASYMKPARQVVLSPSGIPVVSGHGLRVHQPGYTVTRGGGLYTERTAAVLTPHGIPITGPDVPIAHRAGNGAHRAGNGVREGVRMLQETTSAHRAGNGAQGLGASLYFENAAGRGANIQADGLGASLYFEDDEGEGANIKVDGIF